MEQVNYYYEVTMIELRWIYVKGIPLTGDISIGGPEQNLWMRLQYRYKNMEMDWQDVPFGGYL